MLFSLFIKMQMQLATVKFKTLFIQNVLEMIPTLVAMVMVGGGGEQTELGWSEVFFHKSRTVEKARESSQLEAINTIRIHKKKSLKILTCP